MEISAGTYNDIEAITGFQISDCNGIGIQRHRFGFGESPQWHNSCNGRRIQGNIYRCQ